MSAVPDDFDLLRTEIAQGDAYLARRNTPVTVSGSMPSGGGMRTAIRPLTTHPSRRNLSDQLQHLPLKSLPGRPQAASAQRPVCVTAGRCEAALSHARSLPPRRAAVVLSVRRLRMAPVRRARKLGHALLAALDHRVDELPGSLYPVAAVEEGGIAQHRVVQQTFVGFGDGRRPKRPGHSEIPCARGAFRWPCRHLGVDGQLQALFGLQADGE